MKEQGKKIYYLAMLILGIYFFFFLGENGYCLLRDSNAFINGDSSILNNYFVYSMLLRFFRILFGESFYLYMVTIFQGETVRKLAD